MKLISHRRQEMEELKELMKEHKKDVVKIGRLLSKIKEEGSYSSDSDRKSFKKFVEELGISYRLAKYYMDIAKIENAEKVIDEIGYTKAMYLARKGMLNEEGIELAKHNSINKLKELLENIDKEKKAKAVIRSIMIEYGFDMFKSFVKEVCEVLKAEKLEEGGEGGKRRKRKIKGGV
jgi:uncharacterized protein YpuA (DUF1002 family)